MSFVITQNCCKDASCVAACPVNCIHPAPGEDGFATAAMLFVDPAACIDCGACADACPVDAAVPADTLVGPERAYVDLNARWYADRPASPAVTGPLFRTWERPTFDWSLPSDFAGLDVAVVGTGPAGMYAAEMLVLHTASTVTLLDRLPVAGGLVRYGVAPDHPGTKRVGRTFARLHEHPRIRTLLGIDVGTDVTVDELTRHFDAVVLAVGASVGRRLDVPGEDLPGVLTAPRFVGWYNAHPDLGPDAVLLDGTRAVVVGTGNVALDVARVLTVDPETLARTDIADHALAALRASDVGEVVLLGRRGPADAAWTEPELLALRDLPGVDLVVDDHDPAVGEAIDAGRVPLLAGLPRVRPDYTRSAPSGRRIVLRFGSVVAKVLGGTTCEGVELTDGTRIAASTVVTSIGYHGTPLPGVPFDPASGTVPNDAGRVTATPRVYAVGWVKRGSSGGIGDNRVDAAETVHTLLADVVDGRVGRHRASARGFVRRLARGPGVVDARGLSRLLAAEAERGEAEGRPAVKFATAAELRTAAGR